MTNSIKVFQYNGSNITFNTEKGVMVNATEMAKPFGKRPSKWLELPSTKDFLRQLSDVRKSDFVDNMIVTRKGGVPGEAQQGTWFHEDIALEFARWLSPAFAIWCNDRIKELLTIGMTATQPTLDELVENPDLLIRLARQLKEVRQAKAEAEAALEKSRAQKQQLAEEVVSRDKLIEGLVDDIPLADMRQRLNDLVRKGCSDSSSVQCSWAVLYREFDKKFHCNVTLRMANANYNGSKVEYIDKEMRMLPQLYDLACTLFKSQLEKLRLKWERCLVPGLTANKFDYSKYN